MKKSCLNKIWRGLKTQLEVLRKPLLMGLLIGIVSNTILMAQSDSTSTDSSSNQSYEPSKYPTYKPTDRYGNPLYDPDSKTPFMYGLPSNYERKISVDDSLKYYYIEENMGDVQYRPTSTMTYDEFLKWQTQEQIRSYWNQIADGGEDDALKNNSLIPRIYVSPALDRIFGGNYVDIRPNGNITLTFGGRWQRNFNPSLNKRQQRYGGFEFDQNIALNLVGKVGEKLKMNINWNTGATFEFENVVKIDYTGLDHEILQDVDAGTISFPLKGSLIQGSQNIFGFKTVMKFGKLDVTSVLAQQRGKSEEQEFKNGASTREMEIEAADYEMNKHFFLSQFFRNEYEKALSQLPRVVSNVNITRLEVYVRNKVQRTNSLRNFAAFADLGDPNNIDIPPNNQSTRNNLYSKIISNLSTRSADNANSALEGAFGLIKSEDFETIRQARKLQPGVDYDFHPQLGYISLRTALQNDDVLAVAFEYTYNGRNYKVGELSEDYQNLDEEDNVYLKLLRPATVNTTLPMWDLMMKNVYSLRSSRINKENFRLSVIYKNDRTGLDNPALQEGPVDAVRDIPLLRLMNLDNLNINGDKQPDGNFDFVDNGSGNNFAPVTIDVKNGRIYFPVLEPFGDNLEKRFVPTAQYASLINKYVFSEMYDGTKSDALQLATKNKYFIKVAYQSASSKDLQLNGFDIQKGSVVVTVGSTTLTEGAQYEVNYLSGKVKITDEGVLNSGNTIKVRYEKQDLIASQPKTFFGSRLDYKISDDFVLGGTILRLTERPWWRTVRQGNEPSNSTIWGLDGSYSTESRILTKLVDKLPFIQTKEKSTVAISGEFAQLLPGHSKLIEIDGEATAYLDDFEGSETPYFLGGNFSTNKKWKLASTPQRFEEAKSSDVDYGYGRAKLAWYSVDQAFVFNNAGVLPDYLREPSTNSYERYVEQQEVFPNRIQSNIFNQLITFDLAYFPDERGPYNYEVNNLNQDGTFDDPRKRWAGITKAVDYDTDFDNANIEYIEFWLMDPFVDTINDGSYNKRNTTGGKLYLNLGNISEDVMKDSRFFFENGLPLNDDENKDSTVWGSVPANQYLTNGFDNSEGARVKQDLGYDGLSNEGEQTYFEEFLNSLPNNLEPGALAKLQNDPSTDDFRYFLGDEYDQELTPILGRYKEFNGFEGNSPEGTNVFGYSTLPDKEDLNNDNTISDLEAYYEYEVDLNPNSLMVGNNYIVDEVQVVPSGNQQFVPITWYQFRIPIRDVLPENVVGGISNFKSIRFLRMYMTDWAEPVVLRMGAFQYVSSQWRTYNDDLKGPFVGTQNHDENTLFTVSTVNIEENGDANGTIPYVLPSDQIRTQNYGNPQFTNALNNEQSLKLCVDNLQVDDARAVFKNVSQDLINYKKIRLFVHGELYPGSNFATEDNELSVFIRFGTDFTQNYYEVEVPLNITPLGVGTEDRDLIWPIDNEIEVEFQKLVDLKGERAPSFLELGRIYTDSIDGQAISVRGRPDLSDVRVIMLGIRNIPEDHDANGNPIGDPKSICVWLDELRMTGFDETAGWAALGSVKTKLADLATVNLSGKHEHFGFGSLGQNFNARARENTSSYDISSTVLLDKFLPKKMGVSLPMYVSTDKTLVSPEYDPLNPDVRLSRTLDYIRDNPDDAQSTVEEYRRDVLDITSNRSINFSNVRKQKAKGKKIATPLDISNWSFSYAYSESNRTNISTQTNFLKNRRGGINYAFANKMKPFSPLAKAKFLKSKYLKLIRNFNVQPLPSNISFSADVNRSYRETQYRTVNAFGKLTTDGFAPLYEKNISFKRQYSMKWPITKSISMDYRANVMSKVDETEGRIDRGDADYQEKVQVILNNFKDFGRITDFNQNVSASYRVPINQFPLTNWITADLKYAAGYNWLAGPVTFNESGIAQTDSLGNSINNNNTQSINGRLDMVKLYNKVKFLKAINSPKRSRPSRKPAAKKPVSKTETDAKDGEEDDKKKKDKKKKDGGFNPLKFTLRTMMLVRNVNFSYSKTQGTNIPGYMGVPKYFGLDGAFANPGIPFVVGDQDDSIQYALVQNGLMSESNLITQPLLRTDGYNLNLKATIEPFKDFKVQLSAKQTNNSSFQTIFKDTTGNTGQFSELSPMTSGSFSTSFIGIRTFFQKVDTGTYDNKAYQTMINSRGAIKRSLDSYSDNSVALGEYGLNSQDVLIPAFIQAYSGDSSAIDPKKGFKNIFKSIPLPNWNLNYRGLAKLKFLAKHFSSINIRHAYTSTYRVSNYQSSLEYGNSFGNEINPVNYYRTDVTNENSEYISYYVVQQVMIQERMSPLIGLDMRLKKSKMNVKLSYDKSRDLSLVVSNAQITELRSDKINFTMGWVKKDMKFPKFMWPIFNKGRPMQLKNDANFKVNLSVSDNVTIQRDMEGESLATGGMYSFQFKPTIDYEYSKKINVQLYFGRTINNPKVSTSFKNTVTEGGAKIRIAL